ncbi:hypothetical protein AMJ39_02455 [candidate division TA06 bacterium DG_24]|uniref:Gliding motility protein SprA N-terminal domain-containing protein n=1 Tax=candidate division TA06 bacterium DG_24 TaxID=1703770 RepID=A0A0S7WUV1_UNCT6|nr:MAG: hypothetical protein AMJ39_02455 [candidate division TA06 bacterium DG_24]
MLRPGTHNFRVWTAAALLILSAGLPRVQGGPALRWPSRAGVEPFSVPSLPGLGVSPARLRDLSLLTRYGVEDSVAIDLPARAVRRVVTYRGEVLAVGPIGGLDRFVSQRASRRLREARRRALVTTLTARGETGGTGGLVPNIDIPVAFPTPIAGVIGQGGQLKVDGSQRIELGGVSSYVEEEVYTEFNRPSRFPQLDMEQRLLLNLQGTVGEKIHVFVDHDSQQEAELKNKIRIRYEGEEDEIVQEIEAGNTQLGLPSTQYVGGGISHHGLFGIKGRAQVGGLEVTAIASKEEGRTEKKTFEGQATFNRLTIYDREFISNRFFWVGTVEPLALMQVYVDDQDERTDLEQNVSPGKAYFDPERPDTSFDYYTGSFYRLVEGADEDYIFDPVNNVIEMNRRLTNDVLAVMYTTASQDTVGGIVSDTLMLKLLKPRFPDPSSPTWHYALKNYYDLGSSRIIGGSLEIKIKKDPSGAGELIETEEGATYLSLLGLDPDGDGDVEPGYLVLTRGLLAFPAQGPPDTLRFTVAGADTEIYVPDLRPFANDILADPVSVIYDSTSLDLDDGKVYVIEVGYKSVQTIYSLGINILPESEVVKVNGLRLSRGSGYFIDYDTGILTLLSEAAASEDARIEIDYEYQPFFAFGEKTLLGARADYRFSDRFQVGSTWMYRSERSFEERPRLGQEPTQILLGEADMTLEAEPALFTKVADLLPLVETEEPSHLYITGEVAASFPDPNTRGEVFVDDMEGAELASGLGLARTAWSYGTIPVQKDTSTFGRIYWYNPKGVKAGDIEPGLPEEDRQQERLVLALALDPRDALPIVEESWGGISRCISPGGYDFSDSRLLEVWVKGDGGRVHIDLGTEIDEDAPRWTAAGAIAGWNGVLDTEDANRNGYLDVGAGEDAGLDGVAGADGDQVPGDDGNDDYPQGEIRSEDYFKLNRTENNRRLDTENLNRDNGLNRRNDYFEFTIDLEDTQFVAIPENEKGWTLYRVPLTDTAALDTVVGAPDWEHIIFARLWLDGLAEQDTVLIGGLEVVGNRWQNEGVIPVVGGAAPVQEYERFEVATVNSREDPEYKPPYDPGVDREGKRMTEGSLVLQYQDIEVGHGGLAYRSLFTSDDYTDYREIRVYVYGDASGSHFFYRVGEDSANYYGYEVDVTWSGWQELFVDLRELTRLKQETPLDSTGSRYATEGPYVVRGSPSLTNIEWLALGVENRDQPGGNPVSGELWVDDVRLTEVVRRVGTAARARIETKFADLLSLNATVDRRESDFYSMSDWAARQTGGGGRGRSATRLGFNVDGTLQLERFLPASWGITLPLSGSWDESQSLPRFGEGDDVELTAGEARKERTQRRDRRISASFRKPKRSLNRFAQLTLDHLTASGSVSQHVGYSPTSVDTSMTYATAVNYSYSPRISPLRLPRGLELLYTPTSFSLGTGYTEQWRKSRTDPGGPITSRSRSRAVKGNTKVDVRPFPSLTGSYSLNVIRDLELEKRRFNRNIGSEVNRTQTVTTSFSPTLTRILSHTFSYSTRYAEDHPNRSVLTDSLDLRNASNANTSQVRLGLNFPEFVRIFTGLRDEAKDASARPGSPHWLAMQAEKWSRNITSPQASYTQDRQTRAYGLLDRPSLRYQIGLTRSSGDVPRYEGYRGLSEDSRSVSNSYRLSSGVRMGTVNVSVATHRTDSRAETAGWRAREGHSATWPDLSLSWGRVERFQIFRGLVTSSTLSSSYMRRTERRGYVGEPSDYITEVNSFSPLIAWQARWRQGIGTNLSTNYTRTEVENVNTMTQISSVSQEETRNIRLTANYSFSAPGGLRLPFVRNRLRFTSNLDFSLMASYSTQVRTRVQKGLAAAPVIEVDINTLSIVPQASYNFSSSVVGGLSGEYTRRRDNQADRTFKTIEVRVFVEFKF